MNKFGLNKENFATKKEYLMEYNRLQQAEYRNTDHAKNYNREYQKKWREENKEYRKEYARMYSKTDKFKAAKSIYAKTDKSKEAQRKYQQTDAVKERKRKWAQSEYGRKIRNASHAKRRAAKLQRTPSWSETDVIKQFYLNCPKGMHVDHIIPLQGKNVSGLHVVENLRYLTPEENRRKYNKYETT
tara:strand:- start:47 stop:604 length:558 start_codon:yes stop_codon:yes gene_type:complete